MWGLKKPWVLIQCIIFILISVGMSDRTQAAGRNVVHPMIAVDASGMTSQALLEKLKKFNPLQLQCLHAFKAVALEGGRTQDLAWVIPVCQGIRIPEANRLWGVFTSDYSVLHMKKAMHLSSSLAVDVFLRAVDTNIQFFSSAPPQKITLLERVQHPTLEKLIYFLTEYHPDYSAADPHFGSLLKLSEAEAECFIYWMVSMPELDLLSWLLACKTGNG